MEHQDHGLESGGSHHLELLAGVGPVLLRAEPGGDLRVDRVRVNSLLELQELNVPLHCGGGVRALVLGVAPVKMVSALMIQVDDLLRGLLPEPKPLGGDEPKVGLAPDVVLVAANNCAVQSDDDVVVIDDLGQVLLHELGAAADEGTAPVKIARNHLVRGKELVDVIAYREPHLLHFQSVVSVLLLWIVSELENRRDVLSILLLERVLAKRERYGGAVVEGNFPGREAVGHLLDPGRAVVSPVEHGAGFKLTHTGLLPRQPHVQGALGRQGLLGHTLGDLRGSKDLRGNNHIEVSLEVVQLLSEPVVLPLRVPKRGLLHQGLVPEILHLEQELELRL